MKDKCFVNVSGFFYSGSSAIVDLLKEFRGFYEPNAEIRFIRDPYGIIPMEQTLIHRWDWINASAAISDFLAFMKLCARPKGLFLPMGYGLKKTISPHILSITEDYINDITAYTYKMDFYHYKSKKSFLKYQLDRYRWAIEHLTNGKIKTANRNIATCYFSRPSQEQFNTATQSFFDRLFEEQFDGDVTHIILDQAIPVNNTQTIHRYFKKAKMIIIDRDPRDIFCDEIKNGERFDQDGKTIEAARRYVVRSKAMREGVILDDDIMRVRFEDLIIHYDETRFKVLQFLGLKESDHINKKSFLKPEISIKNIGIWHKYYDESREAINYIEKELPELCYDSSILFN